MSESLPLKYRPKTFKDVYGNDTAIKSVESILARDIESVPKAWLFTGASGCGKTTMVRIISKMMKCSDTDYHEYNAANTNGVDTIREISSTARLNPMDGPVKIILLDECFAKGTKILTCSGEKPIEDIKIGEYLYSLSGVDRVVFSNKKKVPLNRVIRLNKSDGSHTFCSEDHPYFVDGKWTPAKELTNISILSYNSESVYNINSLKGDEDNGTKSNTVSTVSGIFQTQGTETTILFKGMCEQIKNKTISRMCKLLRRMWEGNSEDKENGTLLFTKLCGEMEECPTRDKKENVYQRKEQEYFHSSTEIQANRQSKRSILGQFYSYEEEESKYPTRNNGKTNSNPKNKWSIFQREKREWTWSNRTRENITAFFRFSLGIQFPYFIGETSKGLPNLLQDRHCPSGSETGNRSRWREPSTNCEKGTGSKKGKEVRRIRVVNIEVYQPGSNEQSFSSIIGDKEKDQGYVEFYDLQIKNNPSYIADGNMVHNCHMLTGSAQQACLKMLEDAPKKTFFFMATTNPEKMIAAVKTRCTTVNLKTLPSNTVFKLVKSIAEKEGVDLPDEIIKAISKACGGSAREALKILDQVIDIEDDQVALDMIEKTITSENSVVELCRALMAKQPWPTIAKIIEGLDTDPEGVRRAILGYFTNVLLGKGDRHSAMILEVFREKNYFDSGKAGLVLDCYTVYVENSSK